MWKFTKQLCLLTHQFSLWIVTLGAQHKLVDEYIQHVLKFVGFMGSVYNEAVILCVKLSLRPQLAAEILSWV